MAKTPPRAPVKKKTAHRAAARPNTNNANRKPAPRKKKKSDNLFILLILTIPLLLKRLFRSLGRGLYRIVSGIGGLFGRLDLSYFGEYGVIAVIAILTMTIGGIGALVWGLTNKNAYEVYINQEPIGIIRKIDSITAESLTATVTGKISNSVGTKVRPTGTISLIEIHASRNQFETDDAVIAKLSDKLEFQAELISITLEGSEVALLRNEEDYHSLADRLAAPYRGEDMVIVSESFDNLNYTTRYAYIDEITTVADAYLLLSKSYPTHTVHTVQSGEMLVSIAGKYDNVSVENILEWNDISIEDTLRIGQELKILTERPILTVITVEENKYIKEVPYDTIPQINTEQPSGYTNIRVRGVNGEAQITEHTTYINGIMSKTEIVHEEILLQPVNEIVEVGQGA